MHPLSIGCLFIQINNIGDHRVFIFRLLTVEIEFRIQHSGNTCQVSVFMFLFFFPCFTFLCFLSVSDEETLEPIAICTD